MMSAFIGIDLGTTFSAVATIDETGRAIIVHNKEGSNLTPSCVVETSPGVMEVGEFARRQWGNAPDTAAARFKRDMGTSVTHRINSQDFTPTQLSTFVLKRLVSDAAKTLGPIGDAVVTIPANFAHEARDATMTAARDAGLNVRHIINEPTAAALYYAFKSGEELGGIYAVYDLGGGTFDVSIIRVNGQKVEVMATNGVSKLGGDDFDAAMRNLVRSKFKDLTGEDLEDDDFTTNDAEEEKKSLSSRKQVTIRVARQMIDIKREEFEEVIESVKNVFKKDPTSSVNVDEVVALGAALYAAYKGDKDKLSVVQQNAIKKIQVAESTSMCFGTISLGQDEARDTARLFNSILIRKGEKIPCSITESFYTVHDGQEKVACKVTESSAAETDPRFVKVIWEGDLDLPAGRPANQEIKVTFAYDENQIMNCSFLDVATKRETKVDLTMASAKSSDAREVDKFLVE